MSDFNPQDYLPTPNNWFEDEIEYRGWGRAKFENPTGWIEGETVVTLDNRSDLNRGGLIAKIELTKDIEIDSQRKCMSLSVKTDDGLLSTVKQPHLIQIVRDKKTSPPDERGYEYLYFERSLKINLSDCVYRKDIKQDIKYWIMPLSNLVYIPYHPLYKVAEEFEHKGQKHLLELLPDYKKSHDRLVDGDSIFEITSTISGEMFDHNNLWTGLPAWLPENYLPILSLATGSMVGMPWIEYRDSDTTLIGRYHCPRWVLPYRKGRGIITRNLDKGDLGTLLTNSPSELPENLMRAINLTTKSGQYIYELEDKLSLLFRAYDALTKKQRFKQQLSLSEKRLETLNRIVVDAVEKIKELKSTIDNNNRDENYTLERAIDDVYRARNLKKGKIDFLEATLKIVHESGINLKDFDVLENWNDFDDWTSSSKQYRNDVIHEGYLNEKWDKHEVYRTYNYLHDLITRIILKKLNYEWDYTCHLNDSYPVKSVDWVTADTILSELGLE